ncbi:Mpp10 protein [Aphelenchoides avenae]|nr:Mpp10 protein [Aphelenchus avenae]
MAGVLLALKATRIDHDAETSHASWPVIKSVEKLFGSRSRLNQVIQTQLSSAYAELSGTSAKIRAAASGEDDMPEQLMKPDNSELVWQQLAYRNRQFFKSFKAAKGDMNSKVETNVKPTATDSCYGVDDNEVPHENAEDINAPVDDEEETDIFNLRNEDLADLDQELDALRSDDEDEEDSEALEAPKKRFRKSVVDDKFFNLAEMEEFLEAEDKKGAEGTAVGIFDDAEEDDEKPADYRYTDFYMEQKKPKRQSDHKSKTQGDRHVRFADEASDSALDEDEEDDEEEEDVADEIEDEEESEDKRVLLGPVDKTDEKPQTSFEAQRETLREKIEKFERENLQPRSWELSGEVRADEREPDTLLETYLDADFRAKTAPVIVADTTEKLESIIIQRIKDKAFDDVERKVKVDESLKPYRNEATDEVIRKSLTDVYEQEFQKAKGEISRDEDNMDPAVKEIEKEMGSLFEKLDALAHFQYRPTAIKPEVKIVQNMPTMRVEEVGPMASSEPSEALMAPEEILKHAKAAPKATEERDATDKLRERRKKKKKQKIMAQKEIASGEKEQAPLKKKIKKKKVRSSGGNFFEKLQETTENEVREKTKKKKRKAIAGDCTKQSAAQYKL